MLRPFREDESDPSRNVPTRGPVFVQDKPDHEVDRILSGRVTGFGNRLKREYLVSWKGRPPEDNSWEAEETLWRYKDMLDKLKEENPAI